MKLCIVLLTVLPLLVAMSCVTPVGVDTARVVKGNNRFAFDLYLRLSQNPGNLFLSPFSISTALALTSAGARGKTAEQMTSVMHLPPRDESFPAFGALMHALNEEGAKKGYQLSTANALWGAKGYPFRPEFLELAKDKFGATLSNLDFAGDAEGARQTINGWVEKETREKIKDLIAQGVLGSDTRLVLTNAIYFKGNWEEQFKKDRTRDEAFRTATGTKPKVPLMNRTGQFGYAETDDLQALSLLYAGKDLEMLVLLPKRDDLGTLEKKLSIDLVSGILAKMARQEVIVTLPRFKTTAECELSDTLKAMGMSLPFGDHADFSGMTSTPEPLGISKVIHKAFVDVNEEGTEAAAATGVVVGVRAAMRPKPIPTFRADHPFVYFIRDVQTGSVLFLGRLADPTK